MQSQEYLRLLRRMLFVLATLFLVTHSSFAQDTLPKFTVRNIGFDRDGNPNVVISWVNKFDTLSQISIQTSHDSLRNFRTLISLTDPNARMNGFADKRAPHDHMFYRLFIVRGNGQYLFSATKRPNLDTAKVVTLIETVVGKKPDLRDNGAKRPDFVPSFYVYTNKDGYVFVNLPDAGQQKYHIKFFEEDNSFLFEIKNVKQAGLTLDKTNFLHSGWFNFELYNDEKLVERHKFYLGKEF